MNKRTIIISVVSVLFLIIVGLIIGYTMNNGKKTNNTYTGGVSDVDFSSYDTQELNSDYINSGGVYTVTGDINKTIRVNARNADIKLILNNVNMTSTSGPSIYIEEADNVYIELVGDNTIKSTTTQELNGAIYSKADLCFVGDGSLTITSNIDGIVGKDDLQFNFGTYIINASDEGIVGKDSLVVKDGTYTITASGNGVKTSNEQEKGTMTLSNGTFTINSKGDGITSISTLTIEGGTYTITSGNGAERSLTNNSKSMKAIKANGDINIKNGTIKTSSTDDAIHTNGNLTITGGNVTIESGDDGLHSDKDLYINNANVSINKSYEGIEGLNITVDGGNISVIATDDGFNAAGGDGSSQGRPGSANYSNNNTTSVLTINGGHIYVNAQGDGIDSNGNIIINGGEITVDGPTNGGNGPMDYGDGGAYKFEVTGGTLIAVGNKDMAVAPTSSSVTTAYINLDTMYSGEMKFGDITYKPAKTYNSILIVSNKLNKGNTYDLTINNNKVLSLQLNDTITTYGTSGNQGGPGGGDHGGGRDDRRGW